jgi:hypothetical protein
MRKTEKAVIAGRTWETTVFPADIGLKLALEIANKLGPALAAAVEGIATLAAGGTTDSVITKAVEKMVERLKPEETVELCRMLFSFTTVDNRAVVFEEDFAGRYKDLIQVAAWVIRVNGFFDFFDDLRQGVLRKVQEVVGATQSLTSAMS